MRCLAILLAAVMLMPCADLRRARRSFGAAISKPEANPVDLGSLSTPSFEMHRLELLAAQAPLRSRSHTGRTHSAATEWHPRRQPQLGRLASDTKRSHSVVDQADVLARPSKVPEEDARERGTQLEEDRYYYRVPNANEANYLLGDDEVLLPLGYDRWPLGLRLPLETGRRPAKPAVTEAAASPDSGRSPSDSPELEGVDAAPSPETEDEDEVASPEIPAVSDRDLKVAALRERLEKEDSLEIGVGKLHISVPGRGLPPYRKVSGKEVPALESPLLSDDSLHDYLVASHWNVRKAALAIRDTLSWRIAVFPSGAEAAAVKSGQPQALLDEGRRLRNLGFNRDGDLVVGIDFCWGHFIPDDSSKLDVMRMLLLGAEAMIEKADAVGHPQLVFVAFGGPPPFELAKALFRVGDKHYTNRLKAAVVYPVPGVLAAVARTGLAFVPSSMRHKISIATREDEAVEGARLTSAEQLPEDWRGGIDTVVAKHKPNHGLLNRMFLRYLNPFQGGQQLEAALEDPWDPPAAPTANSSSATRPGARREAKGK